MKTIGLVIYERNVLDSPDATQNTAEYGLKLDRAILTCGDEFVNWTAALAQIRSLAKQLLREAREACCRSIEFDQSSQILTLLDGSRVMLRRAGAQQQRQLLPLRLNSKFGLPLSICNLAQRRALHRVGAAMPGASFTRFGKAAPRSRPRRARRHSGVACSQAHPEKVDLKYAPSCDAHRDVHVGTRLYQRFGKRKLVENAGLLDEERMAPAEVTHQMQGRQPRCLGGLVDIDASAKQFLASQSREASWDRMQAYVHKIQGRFLESGERQEG